MQSLFLPKTLPKHSVDCYDKKSQVKYEQTTESMR